MSVEVFSEIFFWKSKWMITHWNSLFSNSNEIAVIHHAEIFENGSRKFWWNLGVARNDKLDNLNWTKSVLWLSSVLQWSKIFNNWNLGFVSKFLIDIYCYIFHHPCLFWNNSIFRLISMEQIFGLRFWFWQTKGETKYSKWCTCHVELWSIFLDDY